jgi:hypothetical protein
LKLAPAACSPAGVDVIMESPVDLTPGSPLVDVTPVMVRHLAAAK